LTVVKLVGNLPFIKALLVPAAQVIASDDDMTSSDGLVSFNFSYREEVQGFAQLMLGPLRDANKLSPTMYNSALLCACAKCGTTSFYRYLYKHIFGIDYIAEYGFTKPWIQNVYENPRWKPAFNTTKMNDHDLLDLIGRPDTFSLALIREPKERFISAWKSKIACDGKRWHTDIKDRENLVLGLLDLAGTSWQNISACVFLSLPTWKY
jgi:hypothetical protein